MSVTSGRNEQISNRLSVKEELHSLKVIKWSALLLSAQFLKGEEVNCADNPPQRRRRNSTDNTVIIPVWSISQKTNRSWLRLNGLKFG